jgi:glycolate oxidase FAD binding subunit
VSAEAAVTWKALAEACEHVRDGQPGDAGPLLRPGYVASPRSTEEASALLRAAALHELSVLVRGGGSRLSWGLPLSACDLVVDTSKLSGVVEHAAGDLVARVRAGTRMGDVTAVLAQAGQEIALDVPADATIGGVVASGLAGPRRLRYGTPRDLVIGITVVRADGTAAKSGGKVVKNVAGYDLGKLFAGSAGSLGLITEVTFRLHPQPAARAYVTASYASVPAAADAVAAAANSPLTASAVELSRAVLCGPLRVGVLLEGSADGVAARADRMADLLGSSSAAASADPPGWWAGSPAAGPGETLIQVSFWVSALGRVLDAIEAAAGAAPGGLAVDVSGSAGAGVLHVRTGSDAAPAAVAGFVAALRGAVAGERGGVTVLAAPAAVRDALAPHGGLTGPVPGLALMRAVKDQFDPGHRMAPGRFPETA